MGKVRQRREAVEAVVKVMGVRRDSAITVDRQGITSRGSAYVGKAFAPVMTATNRRDGKIRISRANTRIQRMLTMSGTKGSRQMSMEEFVESLSPEELVRGRPKDKNGTFRGRPPEWVPRALHQACINELMKRGKRLWQENYLQAIETMTDIATGKGVGAKATPSERLKAAMFVVERMEGKIPEKLIVGNDQPWQLLLDDIVAEVSDEQVARGQKALQSAEAVRQELHDPGSPIVDAEIVEDDEDPSPPPTPQPRSTRPRYHRRRTQ